MDANNSTTPILTAGAPPDGSGRKIVMILGPPDDVEHEMTMREATEFLLNLM